MNFPFAPTPGIRHATKNFRRVVDVDPTVDSLLRWSLHNDAEATPVSAYGAALCRFVGGKRQQLPQYDRLWPSDISERVFIDPTMGSNSVFLHLAPRLQAHGAILADVNPTLVNATLVVKHCFDELMELLEAKTRAFNALRSVDDRAAYYNAIRDIQRVRAHDFGDHPADAYGVVDSNLRRISESSVSEMAISDASVFFMIVWLGFNGLWRVNGVGANNTPFDKSKVKIDFASKMGDLRTVHRALNSTMTDIRLISDFTDLTPTMLGLCSRSVNGAKNGARRKTFVYVDPPYVLMQKETVNATDTEKGKARSFTGYAKNGFDDADNERLAGWLRWLDAECNGVSGLAALSESIAALADNELAFEGAEAKNAHLLFMMSNSSAPLVYEMMRGYTVKPIAARRTVSCDAAGRGDVWDTASRNYK